MRLLASVSGSSGVIQARRKCHLLAEVSTELDYGDNFIPVSQAVENRYRIICAAVIDIEYLVVRTRRAHSRGHLPMEFRQHLGLIKDRYYN